MLTRGRQHALRFICRGKDKAISGSEEKTVPAMQSSAPIRRSSTSYTQLCELIDVQIPEGDTATQAVTRSLAGKLAALQDAGCARPAPLDTKEVATITEVCSGGELPEVEIISLLHETIPKYKLRADSLTAFSGYENQDWFIPTPALKVEDCDLKLSPDQIRETLNYFLLCSNRVSQMTKTYNDIEAVTRLLEEKEKDLELTARIGKELLAHNNKLEASVQSLEFELRAAKDEITQLAHDVIKKAELIQVLTNEVDDSNGENGTGSAKGAVSVELLRRRIGGLEEENRSLRAEATRLVLDTDEVEEREARLVRDVAAQLESVNMEVFGLGDELTRTKEEYQMQKDLLESTTTKLQATEQKLQQMTLEHEQAIALLEITRENQNSLASELAEFKDRYAEVLSLLQDTQEQLKQQRKRGQPMVRGGAPPHVSSQIMPHVAAAAGLSQISQHDSLQSELESSLYSDLSMDSGIGDRMPPFKRVFETVKCATRASGMGFDRASKIPPPACSTGAWLSQRPALGTILSSGPRMSTCSSDSAVDNASVVSGYSDPEDTYPGEQMAGIPGVPGAADLEAALRRLTPAEIRARRAKLSSGYHYDYDGRSSPNSSMPFGLRTPDSIMSTGVVSSNGRGASLAGTGSGTWRLPDRLQIVKPMEGSQTLHHWAQLATPTMSGLLEERPGIQIRGGKGTGELGMQMYSLNDVEEDDEYHPGKRFDSSNLVYTFTNSMVMHPDDGSMAGSMAGSAAASMRGSVAGSLGGSMWGSARGSEASSIAASRLNSARHSPCHTPRASVSRRNSTCTFSTNMGIAHILNERGIKALTPSCVTTPAQRFSPTATPCNSPQLGSPLSTPPSSPPPEFSNSSLHPLPPLHSLISSGADILRRTFSPLPAQPRKPSSLTGSEHKNGGRIVDKVERYGINSLIGIGASPLALQGTGSLYSRRGQQSPMAQLTCLKQAFQQGRVGTLAGVAENTTEQASPPSLPLGVPAQPGNGAMKAQLDRAQRRPRPRQDLGTVNSVRPDLGSVNTSDKQSGQSFSTLGTLSSLLFGRKGGLL